MNLHQRRRQQQRHERLGCAILGASVVLGMVGAFFVVLIASVVGYPVRGGGFTILALAVVFAGALDYLLKRVLGYQSSRASLQSLRRSKAEPQFHGGDLVQSDDAIDAELADDFPIVRCRSCGVRVMPKADGRCPSCGAPLSSAK